MSQPVNPPRAPEVSNHELLPHPAEAQAHDPVPYRVAAVQMRSGNDVKANLEAAAGLIGQAVADGAKLILLPEYFGIMGERATDKLAVKEPFGHGPQQDFLRTMAASHAVWIIGGTVPLASDD